MRGPNWEKACEYLRQENKQLHAEVERLKVQLETPTDEGWEISLKKMRRSTARRCAEIADLWVVALRGANLVYSKDIGEAIRKEFGLGEVER